MRVRQKNSSNHRDWAASTKILLVVGTIAAMMLVFVIYRSPKGSSEDEPLPADGYPEYSADEQQEQQDEQEQGQGGLTEEEAVEEALEEANQHDTGFGAGIDTSGVDDVENDDVGAEVDTSDLDDTGGWGANPEDNYDYNWMEDNFQTGGALVPNCSFTFKTKFGAYFYDLHPIQSHYLPGQINTIQTQSMEYYWNLCKSIADARDEKTDFEQPCPPHARVCQLTDSGVTVDCGGPPPRWILIDKEKPWLGLKIELGGGKEGCGNEDENLAPKARTTTIEIFCHNKKEKDEDTEVEINGRMVTARPRLIEDLIDTPCHYFLHYYSPTACPRKL